MWTIAYRSRSWQNVERAVPVASNTQKKMEKLSKQMTWKKPVQTRINVFVHTVYGSIYIMPTRHHKFGVCLLHGVIPLSSSWLALLGGPPPPHARSLSTVCRRAVRPCNTCNKQVLVLRRSSLCFRSLSLRHGFRVRLCPDLHVAKFHRHSYL